MIDWLKDFDKDFGENIRLKNLKAERFHGNVQLNFSDGVVMNCGQNVKIISGNIKLQEGFDPAKVTGTLGK